MNWEEVLNALGEGVLVLKGSEVTFVNRFLVENQLVREDWKGKHYYEAIKSLPFISIVGRALGKDSLSEEFQYLERFYRVVSKRIGEMLVCEVSDVSSVRKYEQSKREFVDNASHELKTPISVLRGIVETLLEEEEDQRKRHFLEKALRRVEQMQNLVEDLLTLTKLESGRERLNLSEFKLRELVEEVYDSLEQEFVKKEVSFENLVSEDFKMFADRQKLFLLLRNLMDNAVKYNKRGGKVWVRAKKEGNKQILEVEDTGIGIPPEHVPFIFERFYRVDKGRSREMGGTGLGLSIVKHIVFLHGGEIMVHSEPGEGSRFSIVIPMYN
ncbi:histidine kinase [Thermocrinis ruber]|uniref:histidine kinase n=1 Tax=Thermocrinis ruber TaxID=75906 RepID=W0DB33_9AQUI|nr:ATP-binding protein [Thermocrinis ruber]AHE95456.1 histidine kinase [Thermocrinis ruber]